MIFRICVVMGTQAMTAAIRINIEVVYERRVAASATLCASVKASPILERMFFAADKFRPVSLSSRWSLFRSSISVPKPR